MQETKTLIQTELPRIYSRDLVDLLFLHPYTKIEFITKSLKLHRQTSSSYLKQLEDIGILNGIKIGRQKYYVNVKLYELLKNG